MISIEEITSNPLPIFIQSALDFKQMQSQPGSDWDKFGDLVIKDPGLTLHTLQELNSTSKRSAILDISSMSQACMLLGMSKVNSLTSGLLVLEQDFPSLARQGYAHAASRSFHAAYQAWEWAGCKRDHAPDEMFIAALLHNAAEMVLWLVKPDKMQQLYQLMVCDHVPAEEAQSTVFGQCLQHYGRQIASIWSLPPLVQDSLDPEIKATARITGVRLAVQLATVTERGWYSKSVLRILEKISRYLVMPLDKTVSRVHGAAVRAARESSIYGVRPAAAWLTMEADDSDQWYTAELCAAARQAKSSQKHKIGSNTQPLSSRTAKQTTKRSPAQSIPSAPKLPDSGTVEVNGSHQTNSSEQIQPIDKVSCLVPKVEVFNQYLNKLETGLGKLSFNEVLNIVGQGLQQGVGLNRVVYAVYSPDRKKLQAKLIVGGETDPIFNQFQIQISVPNLFTRLLEKQQFLCVNDANRQKFWQSVPGEFKSLIQVNSFAAMSVFVQSKPVGLLYADRETSACEIERQSYLLFKNMGRVAATCLQKAS